MLYGNGEKQRHSRKAQARRRSVTFGLEGRACDNVCVWVNVFVTTVFICASGLWRF